MEYDYEGLSDKEAEARFEEHGPNELPEKPPPSNIHLIIEQVKSPLVYILLAAGIVTLALKHYSDSTIIFIAVILNTVLGFFQEKKASQALYALKQLIHPEANVIRDGKLTKLPIEKIVPGDICILNTGDKVPADGTLLEVNRLFADEAALTGESVPVDKNRDSEIFMGSTVTSGRGVMKVTKTGADTQIGKIASSVQETPEDTPLKKQLKFFSKQLTWLVIILITIVFVVGLIRGLELVDIFTTSVALAVSSIPEGLLVGMTVVLAIGMQRILARKGLVRNLVSAETLGGVTTICIDKTGTLTQGKMEVVKVLGDKKLVAKQGLIANDLDDPMVVAVWNWAKKSLGENGLEGSEESFVKRHPRVDSIPFSSKDRYFASMNKFPDGNNILYVNGAPEILLEWTTLTENKKEKIFQEIDNMTQQGMRLIGMAKKKVGKSKRKITDKDIQKELEWVGLIGLSDPVRRGVKDALEETRKAGVKKIVITGDYVQTALSVLKQLSMNIKKEDIILGDELKKMTSTELKEWLAKDDEIKLFARTTPEQKLKIVEALKTNGEVVAMTGDGVNDAPALSRADIGIVVGDATDVAKESADMVLLDSSFETIVAAIEEGRGIFNNIRKIILYLMSDAFSEIIAVVTAIVAGLPLPVTAAQILWINLVSDGFPYMALTVDPKSNDLMQSKPRSSDVKLISSWMKYLILIVSSVGAAMALLLFIFFYKTTNNLVLAQSVAFATLGSNSLIYVFSIRTLREPFWKENLFSNKWLNLAVLGGFVLQISPFYFEISRNFLKLHPLNVTHWFFIFSASFVMFIIIEMLKTLFRHKLKESK